MPENTPNTCAYKGCTHPVNSPHDEKFCLFHAPVENKGISVEEFNKNIEGLITAVNNSNGPEKIHNFIGFIFPGQIDFRKFDKEEFKKPADFRGATFTQYADFSGATFTGDANFRRATFTNTLFGNIMLPNKILDFRGISTTETGSFFFSNPRIHSRQDGSGSPPVIQFENAAFRPYHTRFEKIRFENLPADKTPVFLFRYCDLENVYFNNCDLSSFSIFKSTFENARFVLCNWGSRIPGDSGSRIPNWLRELFNRKNSIFEEYMYREILNAVGAEQRRLTTEYRNMDTYRWKRLFKKKTCIGNLHPVRRITHIGESFCKKVLDAHIRKRAEYNSKEIKKQFDLEDLGGWREVCAMYRQMKVALDNTKDYPEAGLFYYHEWITRSLALKEEAQRAGKWYLNGIRRLGYWLYKIIAGYGGKPHRSFCWFFVFMFLFSGLHMLNGFEAHDHSVNYDLGWHFPFFTGEFWNHFGNAALTTLCHIIPKNFSPFEAGNYLPDGPEGTWISLAGTAVLVLMIIFTSIGLKRHFRRF